MRSVRPLLALGNGKLGRSIFHFDLPAISTCPGRSPTCERVCYATSGRFRHKTVRRRLRWCYRQSLRDDFTDRMAEEVHRQGVIVLRVHVSGDFYSLEYALKWLEVMRRCPGTRYYFYTRSWRRPDIASVLELMAGLASCQVWYSADADTGIPAHVPAKVRVAWLQEGDTSNPSADLLFRVRSLRTQPPSTSLPMVCPQETLQGRAQEVNCGNCGVCWKQ